ncbi:MAG: N-acetyltransferase [Beijerinckiaceae bacterium]|nr:N-acetyltransferase [Beijerinckiaceae bacterium]
MTSIARARTPERETFLRDSFARVSTAPFAVLRPLRGTHELLVVRQEIAADVPARERLLNAALGAERFGKTSEVLRAGRLPARGLALSAMHNGELVGTVRLWRIDAGGKPALLLGPLAVADSHRSLGVGGVLMREAIARAGAQGHEAIILVGDAPYYERFGFCAALTAQLDMPGPVERARFLALELAPGAMAGAHGMIAATGAKAPRSRAKLAAARRQAA